MTSSLPSVHPTSDRPTFTLTRSLCVAVWAFAAWGVQASQAQPYVNVTVGGEFTPGVYGQVTFGNAPPPPVYNPRPVVVRPVVVNAPVVYMHVPEEHRRNWSHHCGYYDACGYRVQFVQVNTGNRWWEGRGDYRYGDRYDARHDGGRYYQHDNRYNGRRGDSGRDDRDQRYNGHDNGYHRGHDKHRGDD
jgi:hypothetical protein